MITDKWAHLDAAMTESSRKTIKELFAENPQRAKDFTLEAAGWMLDYSKNRIDEKVMKALVKLAKESNLKEEIEKMFTGKKINVLKTVPEAIRTATPVMAILMGVGMFIEVMTATGVRGLIVMTCLGLPSVLWLIVACTSIPLFGAVSSFGACSVLGVPFAYIYASFLGGNSVVVLAAISLIASVGDMMPPTALAGLFAAQVTGVKKYTLILKKCIIPIVILLVWAAFFLAKSKLIAGLF